MDIIFDLTIMVMLLVTIVYAYRLNGKLNVIRNHKAQLRANIEEFHEATNKAIKAVKDLQRQGQTLCKDIDSQISKARLTADEIEILVASANKKALQFKAEIPQKSSLPVAEEFADDLLQEPYNSNFSVSSLKRRFANKPAAKPEGKFNSVNEAELAKILREKQYRDALAS